MSTLTIELTVSALLSGRTTLTQLEEAKVSEREIAGLLDQIPPSNPKRMELIDEYLDGQKARSRETYLTLLSHLGSKISRVRVTLRDGRKPCFFVPFGTSWGEISAMVDQKYGKSPAGSPLLWNITQNIA